MFLLDSLMISGIRWTLQTLATAAEAEMNDDGAVMEQLLRAETRREMGEISDEEFRQTETTLLARLREIRERREGGSGPLGFTTSAQDDQDAHRISVEASVTGDWSPPSPPASRHAPPAATAGQVLLPPSASAGQPLPGSRRPSGLRSRGKRVPTATQRKRKPRS